MDLVVDVHTHAMPMPLLRELAQRELATLDRLDDGVVFLDPRVSGVPSDMPIPCPPEQYDLSARLHSMDAKGVSRQAVSLPPFLTCPRTTDETFVRETLRAANQHLVDLCAQSSNRLSALASVPVGHSQVAAEAEYCLDQLAVSGLALGTQGCGRNLDDPVNEGLWELAAERQIFCLLHPCAAPDPHRTADYWLTQLVGFPSETALAVARLVLAGLLERHGPVLCLAHGGGTLLALRSRLDAGWERKAAARVAPRPPSEYLAELYYDTAVFSKRNLLRLIDDVGPGQVLYGTDTPFDLTDGGALDALLSSDLDETTKQDVAGRTAELLLRRSLVAGAAR